MKNLVSIYIVGLLLVIFGAASAVLPQGNGKSVSPSEEAELRKLVRVYYQRFETGEFEEQFAMFSPRSTDLAVSDRDRYLRILNTWDKVKVEKLTINRIVGAADAVKVRMLVHVSGVYKTTGRPIGGWVNRDQELTHRYVKEDGAWKLLTIVSTYEDVVEEIGPMNSNAEREKVIGENPGILNRRFVSELSAYGYGYGYQFADHKKGAEILDYSLELARRIGDRKIESQICSFMGNNYMRLGDHGLALYYDNRHYELELLEGENGFPANALNNLGGTYSVLGDLDRAIEHFEKSLITRRRPGTLPRIPLVRFSLASAAVDRGDLPKARKEYENIIETARKYESEISLNAEGKPISPTTIEATKNEYRQNIAYAQSGLASVSKAIGDYEKALELSLSALEVYKAGPYKEAMQGLLKQLGEIYLDLKKFDESLKHSSEAAEIALELNIPDLAWDAYLTSARAYIGMGKRSEARSELEKSIAIIEGMRTKVLGGEDSVQRFFDSKSAPYAELARLLVDEGKIDEAFRLGEQIKGRTLLSVLSGGLSRPVVGLTEAERDEERRLLIRLAGLNLKIRGERDEAKSSELRSQLNDVRKEHLLFRNKLYAVHPELRARKAELAEITQLDLANLTDGGRTAIVSFISSGDRVIVFRTKAGGQASMSAHTIMVSNADLRAKIKAFGDKTASGNLDFQKNSRELYDLLLKPVEKVLEGKTNIIIVPDGPLWDLPFQALIDEKGKYLVEKAAISYAPSLTALREMQKRASGRKAAPDAELIAFGNPIVRKETKERVQRVFMSEKLDPLPEAERLVNELGKMYGPKRSKVLIGNDAREEVAKSETPKYRVVQFATHGILNNVSPMYSHLVMAQDAKNPNEDGLLEAWELKDLNLNADMVILSACDTARGKISGGEGIIGMTWASFIAGAPTTVASQWKVESSSTTEFMLEFHRQLLAKKRDSKAEAMRRAALKLMRTPKYRHPSYWGAWVLVGDGS